MTSLRHTATVEDSTSNGPMGEGEHIGPDTFIEEAGPVPDQHDNAHENTSEAPEAASPRTESAHDHDSYEDDFIDEDKAEPQQVSYDGRPNTHTRSASEVSEADHNGEYDDDFVDDNGTAEPDNVEKQDHDHSSNQATEAAPTTSPMDRDEGYGGLGGFVGDDMVQPAGAEAEQKSLAEPALSDAAQSAADGAIAALLEEDLLRQNIATRQKRIAAATDEMTKHQAINQNLIQKAKDMHAAFDEIIAVVAGVEACGQSHANLLNKPEVLRSDIENAKKELAICRHQIKIDRSKANRSDFHNVQELETTLAELHAELHQLKKSQLALVKSVESKEKEIEALRDRLNRNELVRTQHELELLKRILRKRELRAELNQRTIQKNDAALKQAGKTRDYLNGLLKENYLTD